MIYSNSLTQHFYKVYALALCLFLPVNSLTAIKCLTNDLQFTYTTTTACSTSGGTIAINVTNGTGPYSLYVNETFQQQFDGSITIKNLTSDTYQIIITDSSMPQLCGMQLIFVPQGNLAVAISPANPQVCQNGTIALTATAMGGTPSYQFTWTLPDSSTFIGPTLTVSNAQTSATYNVQAEDQDGLGNCLGSDSVFLTVNPNPGVQINGTSSVCPGGTITLTARVSGGTGPFNYVWQNPLGTVIGGNSDTVTVTNAQPTVEYEGTYGVTVTDSNDCSGNAGFPVTVGVTPLSVTIQPAQSAFCVGQDTTTTLTASVASTPNSSGSYTYAWVGNGVTGQTTASVTTPSNLPVGNNTYQVTVLDNNTNCVGVGNAQISVIDCGATLTIVKTSNKPKIKAHGCARFSITVTNAGPNAAENVVVTDVLPSCLCFARAVDTLNAGWVFSNQGHTVTATLQSLAAGQSATFDIYAEAHCPEGKPVTNNATVTANNALPQSTNLTVCAK